MSISAKYGFGGSQEAELCIALQKKMLSAQWASFQSVTFDNIDDCHDFLNISFTPQNFLFNKTKMNFKALL